MTAKDVVRICKKHIELDPEINEVFDFFLYSMDALTEDLKKEKLKSQRLEERLKSIYKS